MSDTNSPDGLAAIPTKAKMTDDVRQYICTYIQRDLNLYELARRLRERSSPL